MTSYNAANERMKRQYFAYLAEAQGHSEQSIDAVAKAISRFEAYTRYKDFKAFHIEQSKAFKRDLANQRGHHSGEPLSKATLYATLTALKRFFVWLAGQPGYKSRISYSDAEYFNLSAKETRIAKFNQADIQGGIRGGRTSYFNRIALGRPWRFWGAAFASPEEYKAWSQISGMITS